MASGIVTAWANRLTDSNERYRMSWENVPDKTKPAVLAELKRRVEDGRLTPEQVESITAA